jgi:hypothetical protein
VKVDFADLAQRSLDWRHYRGDNDVRNLAGGQAVHLEEVDEEYAVLVHGLCAMGGDAPVRRQLWPFRVDPVEAQHRIRIAHIDG